MSKPTRIAIASHPNDTPYLNRFKAHLSDLVRSNKIILWDNQSIKGGADIKQETLTNFQQADYIVMMISVDFFADDYSYHFIIQEALTQAEKTDTQLIVLYTRSCYWKNSPLVEFTTLPKADLPIESKQWHQQDDAFMFTVKALEKIWFAPSDDAPAPQAIPVEEKELKSLQKDEDEAFLMAKGMSLYRLKKYAEAITYFNRVLAISSTNSNAYHNRGVSYKKLGEVDKALEDFEMSIAIYPRLDLTYASKAQILEQKGNLTEALTNYLKAIEYAPNKAHLYAYAGNIHFKQERYEKSIALCQQGLQLAPEHAFINRLMGASLRKRGRHEAAIPFYVQAIATEPNYAVNHVNLGNLYRHIEKKKQALKHYKEALVLDPENKDILQRIKSVKSWW